MLVLAFDGVLFDTLDARALVLSDALAAEGLRVGEHILREAIAGRTFSEAVRHIASTSDDGHASRAIALDATSQDIATLRAGQAFAALATRGFSLNVRARELLVNAATVTRVVLRADSRRREVDTLLAFAGLENAVSMTRCSDDPATRIVTEARHVRAVSHGVSQAFDGSIRGSYTTILERMTAHRGLIGERHSPGVSLEAGTLAQQVAADYGFEAATSISSLNFPLQ